MWQVWPWDPCCFLAGRQLLGTVCFAYPPWITSYKLGTQGNSSDCKKVIFLHGIAIGIIFYCDYLSMNMTCSWSVWLMTQGCSSWTEVHEVNIKMNNIIHRPTASFTLHQEVSAGMALYRQIWPKSKCLSNNKVNAEFLLTHSIQTDEYVNSKMMNSSLSSTRVGQKFPAWPNRNKTTLLFFNIVSLYFNTYWYWYINLTIDGAIYPSQCFPFGAAFACQVRNFWTHPRIYVTMCKFCFLFSSVSFSASF